MADQSGYRVLVLDTNAFGGGVCTPRDVETVKRLAESGVHVVIPDVVVHELVAHIRQQLREIRLPALALVVGEEATEAMNRWQDAEHSFSEMQRVFETAGATVAKTPADWWRGGVVDQIQSNSPAGRKSSVTTGAVDAIVARHAAQRQRRYGSSLVITSDSALKSHLERSGSGVAPRMQDALGLVANNADEALTRDLARHMLAEAGWRSKFVEALPSGRFNPESLETLDPLGFSNLTHAGAGLQATIVFAIHDLFEMANGETSYGGTGIWTAEMLVHEQSLLPSEIFSMHETGQSWDYEQYPGPTTVSDYITLERACLPSPQAHADFTVDGTFDDGYTEGWRIHAHLGDRQVAAIELGAYESEVVMREGSFTVDTTVLRISGEVSEVSAGSRLTHGGYLGLRMLKLWAGVN